MLQQDKTAMLKVDPATVEALQFMAPWASIYDAKILRGKVLSGGIFSNFSQQQREEIWGRLQSFKDLVPSIFELFENVKCLEAWADCLKWLVQLDPRETLSSAIAKIYTGINQSADLALIQENETTFKPIPADSARRIEFGYRQLCAFAMRYHREIPKKPSRKDILAKPRAMLDTARLREMADLANHLGFESSEITALKQLPKSADPSRVRRNERPMLVMEGPGEIKKDRCGLPHVPSYEEDRKFLFINNLHRDTDEQSEGITSYFRLKSVYLKFFGKLNDFNLQRHLTTTERSPVFHSIRSTSPAENTIRGSEPMDINELQPEDTVMQEGDGEGERSSVQAEVTFAQEDTVRRAKNLSIVLEKQEQEHEQYRQKLKEKADNLTEEEQNLEQKRLKLSSDANTLERQEREQEKHRLKLAREATSLREQDQEHQNRQQKLLCDVSEIEKQEQEYQQELTGNINTLREQVQQQNQQQQKLLSDVSEIEKQERKQEERRQKLLKDASVIEKQEQDQERRRQELVASAIALREREQEQEQMYQKFTSDASALREQGQKQEQQREDIARERSQLLSQEQRQEKERKRLAANACELNEKKQRQEEQRQELATTANELISQENKQKEQRETLVRKASDLKDQEFEQSERKQKLMSEIDKLNKQEKRHKELRRNELK